jgi:hypothetical protein
MHVCLSSLPIQITDGENKQLESEPKYLYYNRFIFDSKKTFLLLLILVKCPSQGKSESNAFTIYVYLVPRVDLRWDKILELHFGKLFPPQFSILALFRHAVLMIFSELKHK